MRVLVVENYAPTSLGLLGQALDEAGADIDMVRPWSGDPLPEGPDDHDAIVVLGGAQNALADEICPWLPQLAGLMAGFGAADRPVLGICLGSQLLARAYGAENHIGTATQFGWHQVTATDEGLADPVLSAAGGAFPIFQWHDDTFSLPKGAVHLATNGDVRNQAFRIGRASYGMQFHLEADARVIGEWMEDFPDAIDAIAPGWIEDHSVHRAAHGSQADAAGLAMAQAWVKLIKREETGDVRDL